LDWAVATTIPATENKASADLTSVGFSTYLPKYESVEAVRGRIIKRARPLFPGYLFFELIDKWREIFSFDRITGALMWSAEEPAHLPQDVVDELRDRAGADGVIKFETRRKRRFNVGATVNAKTGPLAGFTGTVERLESKDRVTILFGLFGRRTTVTMREADITAG